MTLQIRRFGELGRFLNKYISYVKNIRICLKQLSYAYIYMCLIFRTHVHVYSQKKNTKLVALSVDSF